MSVESTVHSTDARVSLPPPVETRGESILVVDDEEPILNLFTRVLTMLGDDCRIHTARNGQEALMKVQENTDYDLIICNVRMPIMDGLTFYRTLKEIKPRLVDRVVFCTGDTVNPTRSFFDREAVPCICKPFSIEKVLDFIGQKLRSKSGLGKAVLGLTFPGFGKS